MNGVPLVETTRGVDDASACVENVHEGAVAVVDASGTLLYSAGNPHYLAFTRSALKPFQALPFVCDGGPGLLNFGERELALMCASHSGEPRHLELVSGMLRKADCRESDLCCGAHVPLHYAALDETPPEQEWTPLHNNCSGKHAGFLGWCRVHGVPLENYLDLSHPLQQRIRQVVAELAEISEDQLVSGIDGCSAPNYAIPLSTLAHLYARLARPAQNDRFRDEFSLLFQAMSTHPELVSGIGRTDLAYMSTAPNDWISKSGADGVQAFASRSAQLGIAIKISDGTARALHTAFVATLAQLGLLEGRPETFVGPWINPPIRNCRGIKTGSIRAVFTLRRA